MRYHFIDLLRGLTFVMMAVFHFFFDLDLFQIVSIDFQQQPFWYAAPRVIVSLFFGCAGASLYLAHKDGVQWGKMGKRSAKLFFFSLVISAVTYFLFPTRWVFFGTLHSILVCSWVALPWVFLPKTSGVLGAALFALDFWESTQKTGTVALMPSSWFDLFHRASVDYIPVYPWVGAFMIGITLAHFNLHKMQIADNSLTRPLIFCGQQALPLYLIHQPILISLVWAMAQFK